MAMKKRALTPQELEVCKNLKRIWAAKAKSLGVTQQSAAEYMNITQGAVSHMIQGRNPIHTDALIAFAEILDVHPAEINPHSKLRRHHIVPLSKGGSVNDRDNLIYFEPEEPAALHSNVGEVAEPPYIQKKRMAPVIDAVRAGQWTEATDPYPVGYAESWEPIDDTDAENVFWLRVRGDSMQAAVGPSIPEGHLIKVDPSAPVNNGSLVVAKLEDSNEATFKKYVEDAGKKYLKPLNPAYPMMEINGNCRIIGAVTEAKIKF